MTNTIRFAIVTKQNKTRIITARLIITTTKKRSSRDKSIQESNKIKKIHNTSTTSRNHRICLSLRPGVRFFLAILIPKNLSYKLIKSLEKYIKR
jgi:hypothetical protein